MSDARPACPKCSHPHINKNGHVQLVQRWKRRSCDCGYEFICTTPRGEPAAKHALALLFYSMGRASYGIIARLLKVSQTTVYRWVRQHAEQMPEPAIPLSIKEIEFDEMWHYIRHYPQAEGMRPG